MNPGEITKDRLENAALKGARILVTRCEPKHTGPLGHAIAALGGTAITVPVIEHLPPVDRAPLLDAAKRITSFNWIAFTSARGVEHLEATLQEVGSGLAEHPAKVACVGTATADEVLRLGGSPTVVSTGSGSRGLVGDLSRQRGISECRVLYPRAEIATAFLGEGLRRLGTLVEEVVAYRTVTSKDSTALSDAFASGFDVATFCSASAVRGFVELRSMTGHKGDLPLVASIGPTTTKALIENGFQVDIEPDDANFPSLVEAIATAWNQRED